MLLDWLRMFRAQTAPATICLVLVAFLSAGGTLVWAVPLGAFAWLVHLFSFGENSLLDWAMGYDVKDPHKRHFPHLRKKISLHATHNVIHWGIAVLGIVGIAITWYISPNPFLSMVCFFLFLLFGTRYNAGLSKESLWGWFAISVCFASLGGWAWLLASPSLGTLGWVLIGYFFFTVLFQISWSGNLKEMSVQERSNLLIRLGAVLGGFMVPAERGGKLYFDPGNSIYYGYGVKLANLALGAVLLYLVFSWQGLISLLLFGSIALYFLHQLTKRREYTRDRELLNMSLEEIATIYLPILIVVPLVPALALMAFGAVYFFGINKLLWAAPHPRV